MAGRRRELDSDGTATEMAEFKTVFVDTSLDTHLAMLVSSSDTVSEFKKKIMLEHRQCFPTTGEILIHSLKVKRRSNFYHLPDIMLVWSAFHGVKQNWFLSVDASSDVTRIQTLSIPSPGGASEKNATSEMVTDFKLEKLVDKTSDFQSYICSEENCIGTDCRPKKKHKVGNIEDTCHNPRSEDDCYLFEASCKDTLKHEVVSSRNVMVDAVRKIPGGGIRYEQNGKGNDYSNSKDRFVFKGQSLPSTTQNLVPSGERKEENVSDSKMDHELARDAPTNCSEGIYIEVPHHSARLMDASGGVREVNADRSKMKKRHLQTTAREVQDATEMEQTGMGESITETHESEKKEGEKGMSSDHGHEVMMLSNSKASDHVGLEPVLKEESLLGDANAIMKPEMSSRITKKGKRAKKSFNTKPEQSGIEQASNGTSGLCPSSTDHIPRETGHKEGLTNHEGKDVQLLFDSCIGDAVAEVQGVSRIEGDTVTLTQADAEQTSTEVRSGKKIADRMAQSSAGNCRADLPALETGNPIMESNQVDKSNKNTENKHRKASKRRKKNQKLTASQVQEDLSVEDQRVGNKALATKETSISFVNPEQKYRHVDSSMVPSTKIEQNLKEAHGIGENTYNLVETSEKEGEGINFKQYFVLGQNQDKVDSGVKVNMTKSNPEMETSKSVKDNVAPHISNSTEFQSSIKSCEEKKTQNKSRWEGGIRSKEDSTQSSDLNEINTNSFRRPSGASGKGANNSRPSEMCKATVQNPDEGLASSSHLNKKNCRLSDKSSSGRSEILPGKQGNKSFKLDMNGTPMMLMKTPQKKSLLTKPGGIFQDDSEESSGDENGNVHSDGSTLSPSDSSSMSGHSVEESGLSQDSTRNGYGNAEGKSTGRRNMSKFDLSESKDNITMDMILKSSKRFRKAKLLASQNEEENRSSPIEFVPDSQPFN